MIFSAMKTPQLFQNFCRLSLGLFWFGWVPSVGWTALGEAKVSALLLNVDKTVGGQTTPAVVGDVIQNGGQIVTRGRNFPFPTAAKSASATKRFSPLTPTTAR